MSDPDVLVRELAAELMLDAARSVTERQVRNTAGGHDDLAHLTEAEWDDWVAHVLDLVRTADIDIDTGG